MVMTPPYAHWHVLVLLSAGMFPVVTVALPGFHGVVTGVHGIGVSVPAAALVAVATTGLDSELHMPKGTMFTKGLKSMTVATGMFELVVMPVGSTCRIDGDRPKLQAVVARFTTSCATSRPPLAVPRSP
jgi:hypothetical protein